MLHKATRISDKNITKVHATQHVLEHMNILHTNMIKVTMPKFKHTILCWRFHQIGRIHFVHLRKIHFV